jgi:dienelactone hydrolase
MKGRLIAQVLVIPLLMAFVWIPSVSADLKEDLSKHYRLEKPEGTGPFPAVMLVPGCSGFHADFQKEFYNEIQKRLVELGYVTLRVNSLAARNATNCRTDMVMPQEGADDTYIAAEYLLQQPFVKKEAINIIGWSWGGAAALLTLRPPEGHTPIPFGAVVAYYPACDWIQKWDSDVPVLVLGGSLDNVAPHSKCEPLFSSLPDRNKPTVQIYDGAHHSFDNFLLPPEKEYMFGTLGYNESAAKSAWMEVTNFLQK